LIAIEAATKRHQHPPVAAEAVRTERDKNDSERSEVVAER